MTAPAIIERVVAAVAGLREVLEAERLDDYPKAIETAQQSLNEIASFPGGIDGLREALDQESEQQRLRLREMIMQASIDHRVNGDLIRIAAQKNAALQALIAQESDSATYSNQGQVPGVLGSLLSRKV